MKLNFFTFILLFFLRQGISAQEKAVDFLNIGDKIHFAGKDYHLAWSSHPNEAYYKQEYVAKGDKVEHYKRMIIIDFVESKHKPKDAVKLLIQNLEKRKKTDPVVNYQLLENGDEHMLDFILSSPSEDGKSVKILERNVYRYFHINNPKTKKKGILIFAVSDRAYTTQEMDKLFDTLKNYQFDLVNQVGAVQKLEIQ